MSNSQNPTTIDPILEAFQQGKLLAYPTEAVFGLGCDPDNEQAVMELLSLKQRPMSKGVILVASNYSQLLPYVDDNAIPMDKRTEIFSSWPGPVTWLLPKKVGLPDWISGGSDMIAVRVSAHPGVRALCEKLGKPIVSTSANKTGEEPARTAADVVAQFADTIVVVAGEVGGANNPTQIRHSITGEIIRAS